MTNFTILMVYYFFLIFFDSKDYSALQMIGLLFMNNDGKQIYLNFLIVVILFMTIVVLADDKSIIVRGNNATEWHSIRYPYKSVYGLSKRLKCDGSIHERFHECERSAHHAWIITINDYFYESKKFCCFIWQTLDCEIDVSGECDKEYSKKLETSTEQSYKSMCDRVGSARGSTSCWLTQDRQETIAWIVGIIIFILTLVCACLGIRSYLNKINAAKPKLEISEPFDYRKETHLFVEKNYMAVVADKKARAQKHVPSPPKPPRINKSFLHPDGVGPVTDSASVPKNISSSTSRTPMAIMAPQATTTTTRKTPIPAPRLSKMKFGGTPNLFNQSILHPDGAGPITDSASVPQNISSSTSRTPLAIMAPQATTTTTRKTPIPAPRLSKMKFGGTPNLFNQSILHSDPITDSASVPHPIRGNNGPTSNNNDN
nr:uncharacterized protein LOC124493767 [Dermatophagoides farinae]